MIFGNPWGLLALLGIPAILIIHLFRQRFQARKTSTLFLFGPEEFSSSSGRTPEKIRRSTSLIAEILACLAMTWFISDPHLSDQQSARHLIFLIDSHQRMQAIGNDGVSVETRARQAIESTLQGLNSHDRVTLVSSGAQAQLLSATGVPVKDALQQLQSWKADKAFHHLQSSIDTTADLQHTSKKSDVIVVSDRIITNLPEHWMSWSFGDPSISNSGFCDARWFDDERGQRLSIRLIRQNDKENRQIEIFSYTTNERRLLTRKAISDKQSVQHIIIPLPDKNHKQIDIALTGKDQASYDDHCTLLQPLKQSIRVRLEQDIQGSEHIKRALLATKQVHIVNSAAHIYFTENTLQTDAGTWLVQIMPEKGKPVIGPFLSRSGHPLLQDLDFTGCLWVAPLANLPKTTQSLLQAGSQTLISESRSNDQIQITLHINLEDSSITRHPAWPSLISNLVRWRIQFIPGLQYTQLSTTMSNRAVLPPQASEVRLVHPDGEEQLFQSSSQNVIDLPRFHQAGRYQLKLNQEQDPWRSFIVHQLDERSSTFTNCSNEQSSYESQNSDKVQRIRTRFEYLTPLLIAALAAMLAWYAYRKEQGAIQ